MPQVLETIVIERRNGDLELVPYDGRSDSMKRYYPPGDYVRTVMVIHRPLAAKRYRCLDRLLDDAFRRPDDIDVYWTTGLSPMHLFRQFVQEELDHVTYRPRMPLTPSCVRWFAEQLLANRHAEQESRDGMDARIAILADLVAAEDKTPWHGIRRRRMTRREEGELAGPLLRAMLRHFVEANPSWIPDVMAIMERMLLECEPERELYCQLARIQQLIAAYHPSATDP